MNETIEGKEVLKKLFLMFIAIVILCVMLFSLYSIIKIYLPFPEYASSWASKDASIAFEIYDEGSFPEGLVTRNENGVEKTYGFSRVSYDNYVVYDLDTGEEERWYYVWGGHDYCIMRTYNGLVRFIRTDGVN